jgi:hypothetical protein
MRRIIPLLIILVTSLIITLFTIPGCDELVTQEITYYDTTYIENTEYQYDTACGICHNDVTDSVTIARRQWMNSAHALGSLVNIDFQGQNSSSCGPECHTNEGFVVSLDQTPTTVDFPTEIGCFSCHAPHTNRDFSLRFTDEVNLRVGTYNKELSNICALCHQALITPPSQGAVDITITPDWGPHASTQADMFVGNGGYEFAGSTYNNSSHTIRINNGCLSCHQDMARGFTLGGHSLNISFGSDQLTEACNISGCHDGSTAIEVDDIANFSSDQTDFLDSLSTLETILINGGIIDAEKLPISAILGRDSAGVLFNYLFVKGDASKGVHNLDYATALINSSLVYIRNGGAK